MHVFVNETRPLLQGSRITAWELSKYGVPHTLITDNMAATFMPKVKAVFVGADRITKCGDVANKIGTHGLAIIARHFGVPFYVCAPTSTICRHLVEGGEIEIEQRDKKEVVGMFGRQIAPTTTAVSNPAFDVTPAHLVTKIITEKGVFGPRDIAKLDLK